MLLILNASFCFDVKKKKKKKNITVSYAQVIIISHIHLKKKVIYIKNETFPTHKVSAISF